MKRSWSSLVHQAVALLWAVLVLSSCAVATRGTTQIVPVASEPVGAAVIVNGEMVGVTPLEVELARGGEHIITLRWNGQERSFTLQPAIDGEGGGLLALNAVPGGVIIGLSAVGMASCGSSGGGGWFGSWNLCRDLASIGVGIGAGLALIPVGIDAATGAIMQLSPSEVFVSFE